MSEKFISYDNLKQYDEFLDKELQDIKQHVDEGFTFNVKYAESDEIGGAAIKAINDENDENIAEHFDNVENDVAINKTTLGYTKKNLFKNTMPSQTVNGIEFVCNSDGTVKVNGTATANTSLYMDFKIPYGKKVRLTGCPSSGSSSTYALLLINSDFSQYVTDVGNGVNFNLSDSSKSSGRLRIDIMSGVTVTNLIFKPMVRYADITDDTYEPYVDDVDTRITENKSDIKINETTLGYQKKNLFPVNTKSMSANGWVMGNSGTNVYKLYIPKGEYIFSFKQTGTGQSEINFYDSANVQITRILPYVSTANTLMTYKVTLSSDCYGVKFYNSSGVNTYSEIMMRPADITDNTYEPYVEDVDTRIINNTNDIAINKTTLGYQKKNLLKGNKTSAHTVSGITFSPNTDGSITINGTATEDIFYYFNTLNDITLDTTKEYILYGKPTVTGVLWWLQYDVDGNGTARFYPNGMKFFGRTDMVGACFKVSKGTVCDNAIVYPMLCYADITDDTYEPYIEDVDTRLNDNVNDIVINKTTLGYQKKNLFDWKNTTVINSNDSVIFSKTDTSITVTSQKRWARVACKLPSLEVGKRYIFSTLISDLSVDSSAGERTVRMYLAYDAEGMNHIDAHTYINRNQKYTIKFMPTSSTVYLLLYPNFGESVCTNSFTASEIMLRYADITDDTYEPYVESVDERLQNFVKSGSGAKAGLVPAPSTTAGTTKYLREDGTWQVPPDTNTKNTAGSTNSSSKLFLIGATSQAANPQTYSHDTAYVGTDGCLYSNNTKVSVEGHTHSYLPLSGGTLTSSSFGPISIVRSGSTNAAGITFSNSNGVLGAIGITGDVNSPLSRWDSDLTKQYIIFDTGNAFTKTVPKANGTASVGTATTLSRSDHVHPLQTTVSGNAGSATKLATTRTIDGVSFNGSANITHYGTCLTAAETKAKDVTLSNFSLVTGARISVKFSNTNSADNITLNVNGTGAKPVFYVNSKMTAKTLRLQGKHVYGFVYDGTNWIYEGDSSYSSQNATTTNADYRILLSHTDDDITERGVARKSSKFTANPSTGVLSAKSFKSIDTNLIASGSVKIPSASNDSPQSVIITPENFNGNYYSSLVLTLYNAYGGVASVVLPMNYLLASKSNYIYVPVHFYSSSDDMFMYRPMYMLIQATSTNITLQTPYDGDGYWNENYNNFTYRLYKI